MNDFFKENGQFVYTGPLMKEIIETRVPAETVWQAWAAAHEGRGQGKLAAGQSGKVPFRYQVLEVDPGKSFSILWKAYLVRLIFRQSVSTTAKGSRICY